MPHLHESVLEEEEETPPRAGAWNVFGGTNFLYTPVPQNSRSADPEGCLQLEEETVPVPTTRTGTGTLLAKLAAIAFFILFVATVARMPRSGPSFDTSNMSYIHDSSSVPVYVLQSKDQPRFEPKCCWMLKILKEALEVSQKFFVTVDPNLADIWIVDLNELLKRAGPQRMIEMTRSRLANKRPEISNRSWRMYLLDWSDGGKSVEDNLHVDSFKALSALVGSENIYFAQRAGVEERKPSTPGNNFADPFSRMNWGHKTNYSELMGYIHGCPGHLDFTVRTDLLEEMEHQFYLSLSDNASRDIAGDRGLKQESEFDPVEIYRPKDAAHFWNSSNPEGARHVTLRNAVSQALQSMSEQHPELSLFAGEVGARGAEGRKFVQAEYAAALLKHKIVIVCQRDTYEGHYRLMEALISGAMVMTDYAHYLPKGIKDGESLVVYKTIAEMESKMLYYLHHDEERKRIARAGRRVALEHHRSWQWLERMLTDDSAWPSTCPPSESI